MTQLRWLTVMNRVTAEDVAAERVRTDEPVMKIKARLEDRTATVLQQLDDAMCWVDVPHVVQYRNPEVSHAKPE